MIAAGTIARAKPYLLLLLIAFIIYFIHFPDVIRSPNSVMSNNQEDALKNYYTYVYHITHDRSALHFEGMNYPYGEHVVYTDCQPLLTFVLRLLPFTWPYLVGILHGLIFLSLLCTPLILFRILRLLDIPVTASTLAALAIALLSPQFYRLNLGHYALAYTFVIPLCVLLQLLLFQRVRAVNAFALFILNTLLFLLHPYLGFSAALFSFLATGVFLFFRNERRRLVAGLFYIFLTGMLPLICFQVFMALTDQHPDRPALPFGLNSWNADAGGMLVPAYGPLRPVLSALFGVSPGNFEGFVYLGLFVILLAAVVVPATLFLRRQFSIPAPLLALFIASVALLLLSFGLHILVMEALRLDIPALNQFRATGRFAWHFYYVLPLVLLVITRQLITERKTSWLTIIAGAFLVFNLFEAHFFFRFDINEHWKFRNIFNKAQLTEDEKKHLSLIAGLGAEAIVPLRMFHGGSEMYERPGFYYAMPPAMLYSWHTGLPVISAFMSRTSISETENVIDLLNPYKRRHKADSLLRNGPYLVVKAKEPLFVDEERLYSRSSSLAKGDSVELRWISRERMFAPDGAENVITLNPGRRQGEDNICYVPWEDRQPFLTANLSETARIWELDSNVVQPGEYVMSVHYHYSERSFRAVSGNVVVARKGKGKYDWLYNPSLRLLSGFYKGFAILEYKFPVEKGFAYEFLVQGYTDRQYHVSNFLLRPSTADVKVLGKDTLYNNFPVSDE